MAATRVFQGKFVIMDPATGLETVRLDENGIDAVEVLVLDGAGLDLNLPVRIEGAVASTVTIALAASVTTDGMDITITAKDALGNTVAAVHVLEVWISEAATGIGLTADSYSGTVTASTGAVLTALTAKKHLKIVTAASGIAVLTAVDSANPTDQYVVVRRPLGSGIVVSAASGTSWEGAA